MTYVRIRMDVAERTDWDGVSTVINLPADVDPDDTDAVARYLGNNPDAWADALAAVTGIVRGQTFHIEEVRRLE